MDIALWLYKMGLSAPTAALWATLGVCAALVLVGVACVAFLEGWRPHRHRQPQGASRVSRRWEGPGRQR